MNLLIVLITYERLSYTQRTLRDLWKTIELPYYLVVVDNASTDGTQRYLKGAKKRYRIDKLILNPENYYPGKAANIGWTEGLKDYPEATHLMRLDNDMSLKKGWDVKAEEYFDKIDRLGQLGLDFEAVEDHPEEAREYSGMMLNHWPFHIVGGPCIIKRKLWDGGVRYDETPWHKIAKDTPTAQEDVGLSKAITGYGYLVGHMTDNLSRTFATRESWKVYPEYYKETMAVRGYDYLLEEM